MGLDIQVFTENAKISREQWGNFVSAHPDGNFFQSPAAFAFFQSVENHKPYLLVACDGGEIIGLLLAVFIREGNGVKGFFSRRCIIAGGPLVLPGKPAVAAELLQALDKIAGRRAIYSQFRNSFDTSALLPSFGQNHWSFIEHLNILVDLSRSEQQLWAEVHAKRRNEIRRAGREGTSFGILTAGSDLPATYAILKQVYQRARLPLPSQSFFQAAFDNLWPEHFKIFLAWFDGKIIGTMYTLCYADTLYDWYAGSYQDYYDKYPNDLIPWQVFLWAKENGYKKFDFGGAGKPGVPYGVRDYKKKFGGELVNYGRYEKIHRPALFKIGKLGFKFYQMLKK